MKRRYYSHGKLLITGEYAVLDGALSLALPTKPGQSLTASPSNLPGLKWHSLDPSGAIWFETHLSKDDFYPEPALSAGLEVKNRLLKVLNSVVCLNPMFFDNQPGLFVETRLEFKRDWGLGSSSTLINNIAQWSGTDAFEVQKHSFGGSGYDIACAQHDGPITFQRVSGQAQVEEIVFEPAFSEQLYFVHLNRKQDTRRAIDAYNSRKGSDQGIVEDVSALTREILAAGDLAAFERLLDEHEKLLSVVLDTPRVKELYFRDFSGSIKSLGAWGGDFVLATGGPGTPSYFHKKGFQTVLPYKELIL